MRYALALVLSVAVLSACGGGDDADSDTAAADTPAASSSPEGSEPAAGTEFASDAELRAAVLAVEPGFTCKTPPVDMSGEGPNIFYDQGWVNDSEECKGAGPGRVFLSFWDDEEDKQRALDQSLAAYESAGLPVLAGSNWAVTGDDYDLEPLQEALGGELLN
jgi:hypothetical protein